MWPIGGRGWVPIMGSFVVCGGGGGVGVARQALKLYEVVLE
jgi:hypothetical protein